MKLGIAIAVICEPLIMTFSAKYRFPASLVSHRASHSLDSLSSIPEVKFQGARDQCIEKFASTLDLHGVKF